MLEREAYEMTALLNDIILYSYSYKIINKKQQRDEIKQKWGTELLCSARENSTNSHFNYIELQISGPSRMSSPYCLWWHVLCRTSDNNRLNAKINRCSMD